ncbi:MAG: hypothetical protein QME66_05360 [Candidatus Eisenbacteria bacterium]|nr:hypothetical protein [Candidatus Eisenbacteria bacterium]
MKLGNERGTTVALLIMAILLLSMLGMVTASMVAIDSDEAYRQEREGEAGYIAEAGIEYAVTKLESSFSWGGLPSPGRSVGNGSFVVSPPSTLDELGNPLPSGQKRVVVTGTVQGLAKSLRVKVGIYVYGAYIDSSSGLTGGSGANKPTVNGNIYVDGDVDTSTFKGTRTFYVPPNHTGGEIYPDPQPAFPTLPDTTTYGNLLTVAKGKPAGDYTLNPNNDLNLTTLPESTLYVNGDFNAKGRNNITGPGKIVAFGTFSFKNIVTVGDRVKMICQRTATLDGQGGLESIWSDSTFAENVFYSRASISLRQGTANGILFGVQGVKLYLNAAVTGKAFTWGALELNRATINGYFVARSITGESMPGCTLNLGTNYFPPRQPAKVPGSFREL